MAMTPMMVHYLETKKSYPDCILFYRLGDFYEMFFDDAKTASRELELTLTGRNCGLEIRCELTSFVPRASTAASCGAARKPACSPMPPP